MTSKLALQWLPCQAPGVIGSALGLVRPVSVYCDWVRWKVWSATCISVWQHVKLSSQIRPWDTLACCWDVKQPTNNNNPLASLALPHHFSLPSLDGIAMCMLKYDQSKYGFAWYTMSVYLAMFHCSNPLFLCSVTSAFRYICGPACCHAVLYTWSRSSSHCVKVLSCQYVIISLLHHLKMSLFIMFHSVNIP